MTAMVFGTRKPRATLRRLQKPCSNLRKRVLLEKKEMGREEKYSLAESNSYVFRFRSYQLLHSGTQLTALELKARRRRRR